MIYGHLYRLNAAAYNGRYHGNPAEAVDEIIPDFPDVHRLVDRAVWIGGRWLVHSGHYKLAKLLEFYVYQVSEDATRDNELTKALTEWLRDLRTFIVQNSFEYAAIGWGEV